MSKILSNQSRIAVNRVVNSILIIAAEASSVPYAKRILEHWNRQKTEIKAFGVGSTDMESIGFERLGKSEEMAVVGIAEVLQHYGAIKKVFHNVVEEARKRRPAVALLLDYPGFNLRLAKELHKLGIPVVYYISPQIWAWKQGRVHAIKKYCDKVLLILPFEVDFYKEHGVPIEFVGHPILDEMTPELFDSNYTQQKRESCGFHQGELVLGLMPGSRRSELKHNFSTQLETARILLKKYPETVKILILCSPNFERDDLLPYLENFGFPYQIIKDEPFKMIQLTDLVLVTSGTATLMVGLLQKPMVIIYKFNWLTTLIARMIVKTKFFGLVNLILDREVVPECFQEKAEPQYLAKLLSSYIDNPKERERIRNELGEIKPKLGDRGITERVVKALATYTNRS